MFYLLCACYQQTKILRKSDGLRQILCILYNPISHFGWKKINHLGGVLRTGFSYLNKTVILGEVRFACLYDNNFHVFFFREVEV